MYFLVTKAPRQGPDTWEEPNGAHRVSFDIRVRLPRREKGDMILRTFRTDLPMFAHHVGALEDNFYFEQLKLSGEGMPMFIEVSCSSSGLVLLS